MDRRYEILDLEYTFGGAVQHLYPVVLLGGNDVVLVDCGYPGSLFMLEAQLLAHGIGPTTLTKLVLTHQDDDHMGAAAALKKKYPGIEIAASSIEAPYISGKEKNLRLLQAEVLQSKLSDDRKAFGERFCQRYRGLSPVPVDVLLRDGQRFDWGGGCEIIATPGHMPGHISIRALDNAYMITGDAAVSEKEHLGIANPEFCLDSEMARRTLEKLMGYQCGEYICYHGGVWMGAL